MFVLYFPMCVLGYHMCVQVTYTSCLDACGPAGRWEEALGVLRDMAAKGVASNAFAQTAAAAACVNGGR